MRLLLVDDEISLLRMMSLYLRERGYQVETAVNGREGWKKVFQSKKKFDAVITDKTMPDGDGLEFIGRIREQIHEMPVILISGDFNEKTSDIFFDESKYFFLSKPFELQKLESILIRIHEKNGSP